MRNRLRIRVALRTNSESFPESRSGLRSEWEYDFGLRANFFSNGPDISNDRHREFLWGTVNRRIGIRFRHVLRAGRRDVDGGHSRTFADVNELPAPSSQLAADSRPVRQASPRRFRRGFGKTFGVGRRPQRVVRNTRPTAYFVKTNPEKEENRRTLKSVAKSRGKSRERADGAGRRLHTEDT